MTGDHLKLASLLRLLSVMALVLAPHLVRLPLWESAAVAALLGWRALAAMRQWPLPSPAVRLALTLLPTAGL
ncbi:MAG TPA: DUF3488 domain-containing protein, partial [Nevskiaceae bacterium]|nr:DUF3488 domain-containing protein [Nevskiaceae bacterium]